MTSAFVAECGAGAMCGGGGCVSSGLGPSGYSNAWLWALAAVTLPLVFLMGMFAGAKLVSMLDGRSRPPPVPHSPAKTYHDVEVQGPVRYTRHYSDPRFVAQGDSQWGAWTRSSSTRAA